MSKIIRQTRAMETDTIQKNEGRRKSQMIDLIKNLMTSAMLMCMVLPAYSKPVTENTARQIASQTLSLSSARHNTDSTTQLRAQDVSKKTLLLLYKSSSNSERGNINASMRAAKANASETVYFYVFGAENNEGFVIVSGDDRATPVLGYSHTNGFSADNMPPNLQWWLSEYAKQIQFAIENDIEPTAEVMQQWEQYLGTNDNDNEKEE